MGDWDPFPHDKVRIGLLSFPKGPLKGWTHHWGSLINTQTPPDPICAGMDSAGLGGALKFEPLMIKHPINTLPGLPWWLTG